MDKIEELLTRGVDTVYPTKEELEKVLRSGKTLTIYQGFDPTGSQLHLGHMTGLMKLRQWQQLGHKVIFLIGDFTAMIGDPTGKTSARKVLSHEEVLENAKTYKEQASKILDFNGENPVEIKFNGEWLGKMSAIEFLKIARLLSVQQVVERDMFQERQKKGEDIYMNEFLYPVMQAYDSVAMKVDVELGGTDQMFNMLMGRKLMRHMIQKEKFVMTTPLLTDSEGRKIGKTEGNVIGLTDKPNDLFEKIMELPDDIIAKAFEYLTTIPMEEVLEIRNKLIHGENPIVLKKRLALTITEFLNDRTAAENALEEYEKVKERRELPTEIKTIIVDSNVKINEQFLVLLGLAKSNSEARRLFEQGGVTLDGIKISSNMDFYLVNDVNNMKLEVKEKILKVGQKKIVKLKVSQI